MYLYGVELYIYKCVCECVSLDTVLANKHPCLCGYFRLFLVAPRSVVCSCRVRGALCELVLGVVVPVLLLLFTSAAARAGGALSRLFTWALILAALVLLLLLRPGAGGTSGSSP